VATGTRIELGGVRWWLVRGAEPEATTRLLQSALDALHGGAVQNLKTGRRKQLYPLDLRSSGAPDHLLKVNDYRGTAGLRRAFRGSKARHELQMAERVASRGIPTALPLAAGERRSGGLLRSCYLLMPILQDAVDLRRLWLGEKLPPTERRALVASFGALARRIHDAGVFQDDFAPNNFLVRRGVTPQLLMIDFERAELRTRTREPARRWMLAKIDRELAGASAGDRMRFLYAYCDGDRSQARRWWHRIEGFAPRLGRRDFARLRRKATRDGRSFRRLGRGAWRGYARVGVDDAQILEALPEDDPSAGEPRADAAEGLWRVQYLVRESEGERIWVMANFLWARGGLCPRPLGALRRGERMVLLLERRSGEQLLDQCPDRTAALAAAHVLLDRVAALGEIREPPLPGAVVVERREGSAPRASLAAPHGVRLVRRPDPRRRERVTELLQALRESREEGA
jgi:hypothetical protein